MVWIVGYDDYDRSPTVPRTTIERVCETEWRAKLTRAELVRTYSRDGWNVVPEEDSGLSPIKMTFGGLSDLRYVWIKCFDVVS